MTDDITMRNLTTKVDGAECWTHDKCVFDPKCEFYSEECSHHIGALEAAQMAAREVLNSMDEFENSLDPDLAERCRELPSSKAVREKLGRIANGDV